MSLILELAPRIALFLVVVVAAMPAVTQARMLLLGTSAFYTAGAFASVAFGLGVHQFGAGSLLVGGVAGGLTAAFLAIVCRNLRGDYFALATLCIAELLRLVLLISPPFVGPQGIPGVPPGYIFGISLASPWAMAMACIALLAFASALTLFVMKAPWGATVQATRDNERAARTTGLASHAIRRTALIYAGVWAGLSGALGVRYLSLADVNTFALSNSILVLVVLLLAARPSVPMALIVGLAVSTVAELLRLVTTGAVREIYFGGLLLLAAIALRGETQDREVQPT